MSSPIISVNHISKQYRLGNIGAATLAADFNRLLGNVFARKQPSKKDLIWALNDINFSVQEGD